ncbi:glycosyltransferase [Lacticaseibacillus paracasei subsp. paracasei Lpp41]|uniref:Glycosyltransferase n=1 Tax=Lacticaseibacillus paracasei subsp. paracasei Lpp41 TaxID=1256208 RepID=A0A829H3W4_LACPA|nr:glycosyltransferase [Lacticaseibacillus paracasei subsp. paracasei Lpp41]
MIPKKIPSGGKMNTSIVHVLSTSQIGGAEKLVSDVSDKLQQLGYAVTYLSPSGPIHDYLTERGISNISVNVEDRKALQKVLRRLKPGIIHSHDFRATLAVIKAMPFSKIIAHIHHSPTWQRSVSFGSILFLLMSIFINQVIYVSDDTRLEFVFHRLIAKKSRTITNGIDMDEIRKLANQEELSPVDLVFVGRLEPVKNPLRFIRIVLEITQTIPDIQAVVVGDGSLRQTCLDLISELKLENNIIMRGSLANPYPDIKRARVLISTSQLDAFGLVVLEAATLRTIPVGPNISGLRETLAAVGGKQFDSDKDAISQILDILKTECSYSVNEDVLRQYSIIRTVKKIIDTYKLVEVREAR